MSTKQPTKQPTTPQGHLFLSAIIALAITCIVGMMMYLSMRQFDWQVLLTVLLSSFLGSFSLIYKTFQNPATPPDTSMPTNTQNELLNFLSQQFGDIFQRLREMENHTHTSPSSPPVPSTPPPSLSNFTPRWSPTTNAVDLNATQLRPSVVPPPAPLQPPLQFSKAQQDWTGVLNK